eukprot:1149425-Rhodomonas_salina.1
MLTSTNSHIAFPLESRNQRGGRCRGQGAIGGARAERVGCGVCSPGSVVPSRGPVSGRTLVTVLGSGFASMGAVRCVFGSTKVWGHVRIGDGGRVRGAAGRGGGAEIGVSTTVRSCGCADAERRGWHEVRRELGARVPQAAGGLAGSAVEHGGRWRRHSDSGGHRWGSAVVSTAPPSTALQCSSPADHGAGGTVVVEVSANEVDYTEDG